jgi:dTDP-4-amino-4,6-dideoxygalactose transaminase
MDELSELAAARGLVLIEDCAHAIETEYKGGKAGTFGTYGCFSFYATKNVTTGEGGIVLTHDEGEASRIKRLALHGLSKDAWRRYSDEGYKHYYVTELGFKCNMTDLQAAIGIHQLARVDRAWQRRQLIWREYDRAFRDLPLRLPAAPEAGTRHAYHLYTVLIDEEAAGVDRDVFMEMMTRRNIGVGVHYLTVPEHPFYRQAFGWRPEDHPHAMRIGRRTVSQRRVLGLSRPSTARARASAELARAARPRRSPAAVVELQHASSGLGGASLELLTAREPDR